MGWFDWLWKRDERATLADPEPWMFEAFGASRSSAGVSVTPESAMRLSAVSACVRLISESIASLPLHVYRRSGDGRRSRVNDDPRYRLLHGEPNRLMTSFVFRDVMSSSVLLQGNAYALILRNRRGDVLELLPVPYWTAVQMLRTPGGEVAYDFVLDGRHYRASQWDMLHIPGLSFDGVQGVSPIRYAAESIGLGIAAERFGGTFFGNNSRPAGLISVDGRLSADQTELLRKAWYAAYGGVENSNKTAILQGGAKFERITIPPDEAQFIETRKFQVGEIARWYRVPPHMIGDLERATFSNIEHQSLEFVTHTLRPWLVRWEQELNRKLFPSSSDGRPSDLYAEFSVDGLLRGDVAARSDYYMKGRQWGWLSINDIRALENMEPVEGGDGYLTPLNMAPLGAQPEEKE